MSEPKELEPHEVRERTAALFRYAQVGLCVNSVTHDINNYLGAILAYAELVDMGESLSPDGHRMVHEIIEGVRRSTSLLSTLTVVARREKPSVTVLDPVRLLSQVIELRSHDIRFQQIQIEQQSDSGIPSLVADQPKLELALMYLFSNACEAVDGQEVRSIRVGVQFQNDTFRFFFWNSGPAVSAAALETMFTPFITSKAGEHLGLGLAKTREIAALHDGTLTYTPEGGFVMALPRINHMHSEA